MEFKLSFNKKHFYFYSLIFVSFFSLIHLTSKYLNDSRAFLIGEDRENRVIKCQLPLDEDLTQNVFYVAPDLQSAKKQLFNAKNGLFFDNELFIKTTDFNGNTHVVPFSKVSCDSVGTQVII